MTPIARHWIGLAFAGAALAAPQPAFSQAGRTRQAETVTLEQGLTTLKELVDRPAPGGLSPADAAQWKAQTDWLGSAYQRLTEFQPNDAASGQSTGRLFKSEALRARAFDDLRTALRNESRKFQTVSNASRARHDAAMAVIGKMKP